MNMNVEGILALVFGGLLLWFFLKLGDGSGDSQLGFGPEVDEQLDLEEDDEAPPPGFY